MAEVGGLFLVLAFLFGIFVMVLWIILPFAVFGIKGKIDDTNKRLDALTEQVNTVNKWIKWYAGKSGMLPADASTAKEIKDDACKRDT